MVVSIILGILKIIGITLLCILGLILLGVLVVLFVPIRYIVTADGNVNENKKEYHMKASVSWLLWLVRGKYEYPSEDGFILKVGPFTVYGGKEKTEREKKLKSKKKVSKEKLSAKEGVDNSDNPEISENTVVIEDASSTNDVENTNVDMQKEKAEDARTLEEMLDEENEKKANRKTLKEKILYTRQKICDKINKIWLKIKNILANIKKYVVILQSDEFRSSFALCKDSASRLFCMIKPRKVKIRGTAGFNSPEQTGYMCAVVGVISPFFKNQIQVSPDFEKFIIDGNAMIKGRIYLFVILMIAVKVFFDKNIRKVIEMFRREES